MWTYQHRPKVMLVAIVPVLVLTLFFIQYQPSIVCQNCQYAPIGHIQSGEGTDVLKCMTIGHWKTRPLSNEEKKKMYDFRESNHARFAFPPNFQRKDGRCGNLTYENVIYFRALCNPRGKTPCCFHNSCQMKPEKECVCEDCYDLRQEKYAEFSSWVPSDSRCSYREFSREDACQLLKGSTLHFVGDSLVRHIYTAMLLVLTGDYDYGALVSSASDATRKACKGIYMFTEKFCRLSLSYDTKICGGEAKVVMKYIDYAHKGGEFLTHVKTIRSKSLIIVGIGIHNDFDINLIDKQYFGPVLREITHRNATQPLLLWANIHAPGMFKSPVMKGQIRSDFVRFNTNMAKFMGDRNISVFETFNLTDGMSSFDGTHYGMGINVVKSNILLHYIAELRHKNMW
ncbi:uncharacterized protein LOC124138793 [Haliotis rufescens]|uniref:uncharacterized protein LOC124138793 n=1 Tax=Haliotis rufescens TaxID=6454 RepID=UPI00201EC28C|nr:uncharacterized protein LOC124138793 [Haliotis rufescens]